MVRWRDAANRVQRREAEIPQCDPLNAGPGSAEWLVQPFCRVFVYDSLCHARSDAIRKSDAEEHG